MRARPRVADPESVRWRVADLLALADASLRGHLEDPHVKGLLAGIADHSSYLWHLIVADPPRLLRLLDDDPISRLDTVLAELRAGETTDETDIMRRLRKAKQEIALLVALADLGGVWSLEQVMQGLSRTADTFIDCALRHLLLKARATGSLRLPDVADPVRDCGLVVLGLGKLGGFELNYSSDVDPIVVFDPESPSLARDDAKTLYVKMVRDLVRLLQTATSDGFVLRVDLRLRPDPGATAVAIGLPAAFHYYETYGQNWERAAMIKARYVAGDRALGEAFLAGLAPFVWRKYFDYAAIADIHAMKRQIHAVKGGGEIAVAGHNVKLGRGGIREIEFFVQTQQLIFGGKRADLRGSRTVPMLRQLRRDGWVSNRAAGELSRAYTFLRRVEHRLQMLADQQTHRLPSTPEAMLRFARFCGFASAERFGAVLTRHLRRVVHHYSLLFENAPALDDAGGSLVFTGVDDDPETIETLARLGYAAPRIVAQRVREWHSGRSGALRSARARETLTDLVPKLLVTFARSFDPDAAIASFDQALERMPAAGELFAILLANAALRDLFGDILGSAPRLADAVTLRPHLLDAMIGPAGVTSLDADVIEARVVGILARTPTEEDFLDAIRDFLHEEQFLIGVRLLSGALDPEDAGLAYTALAVGIIRVALRNITDLLAQDHGTIPGGALALVALGKLGSREMTATSDLDIVLLYEFDAADPLSDGRRPLHATRYYTRVTQKLVSHLTVATRRGQLYDVDMRLRPSGNQGPLATKLSAFVRYQRAEAETWEHMALSRARVIAGDSRLTARVNAEIRTILRRRRPPGLMNDVIVMRALIEKEKPAAGAWDFKLMRGGLIDIEFIAQYVVLAHAAASPTIIAGPTQAILAEAGRIECLTADDSESLIAAHQLYTNLLQIMRLALAEGQSPEHAGEGVKQRLAAVVGVPDFTRLADEIERARQAVREIFEAVLST